MSKKKEKEKFQKAIDNVQEKMRERNKKHDKPVKILVVFAEKGFDYFWITLYCSFFLGFTLALILVLFNIII